MGLKGLILGDIAGGRFENQDRKRPAKNDKYDLFEGSHFSDDTIMAIATLSAAQTNKDYADAYRWFGSMYPNAGYGKSFNEWMQNSKAGPYNSFGNGSAMRSGALGELYARSWTKRKVEAEAKASAAVTHNHPEGIKGAKVIAVCTWMLERGRSKEALLKYAVKQYATPEYAYGCDRPVKDYAKELRFDCSCQNTVSIAIRAFYDTNSFDECMRLITSMQCDADTIGAMAGCLCESCYGQCTDHDDEILAKYLDKTLLTVLRDMGYFDSGLQKLLPKKTSSFSSTYTANSLDAEFFEQEEFDFSVYEHLYSGAYTDEEIEALEADIDWNASFGIATHIEDLPEPGQLQFIFDEQKNNVGVKAVPEKKKKESSMDDEYLNNIRNDLKHLSATYGIDASQIQYDEPGSDGVGAFVYKDEVLAVCDNAGIIFKEYGLVV